MKPLNNIDKNLVIHADNLETLKRLSGVSFRMIYIDPPFNTGHTQKKETLVTKRSEDGSGTRTGFGGRKYSSTKVSEFSYEDSFDDYIEGFLGPRLLEAWNLLSEDGTIYVRKNARWEEVEPDSPILTFPLLNIHHERADDAVKYWDIAVKNNNEITTSDVQPYL